MTEEFKNIFFSTKFYNNFQKYQWYTYLNGNNNYHFNYKGVIADYYLPINCNNELINFEYILGINIYIDDINNLLILINIVNQKNSHGYFVYDFDKNKIKFYINKQYFRIKKDNIIEDIIERNFKMTNHLFSNFALATHNLIYAEKLDSGHIELMFLDIVGNA